MLYRLHLTWAGFVLTTLVVICTDCTGSCKTNYHTTATMKGPLINMCFACVCVFFCFFFSMTYDMSFSTVIWQFSSMLRNIFSIESFGWLMEFYWWNSIYFIFYFLVVPPNQLVFVSGQSIDVSVCHCVEREF